MDEAVKKTFGYGDPERVDRAFQYLKATRYKVDPFLFSTITRFTNKLYERGQSPLAKARGFVDSQISESRIYSDHPGLKADIEKLLKDSHMLARPVGELADEIAKLATTYKQKAEQEFGSELAAWRAINDLDWHWYDWQYSLWLTLKDDSFAKLQAAFASMGDEGRTYAARLGDEDNFGDAIRQIRLLVNQSEEQLKTKAETALSVGALSFHLPKRLILVLFPFLFVLSSLACGMLKLRARTATIWIAALEKRIDKKVSSSTDPMSDAKPLNAPTVSPEVLNSKSTLGYLKDRQWARLFDDNPTLLSDALYSVASWAVAGYLILWPWRRMVSSTSGYIMMAPAFLTWAIILLSFRVVLRRAVLEQTRNDALGPKDNKDDVGTVDLPVPTEEPPTAKKAASG
jgi:hypothetical protein